tara:strand:+ start:4803 stop:5717 length:915 start_codon:yes stop_codon:yes gene_type:complete
MSAHNNSKHTVSAFFLRTVQHAKGFGLFIEGILGGVTVNNNYTIVYILHDSSKAGESAFNTISRSLDQFNSNFITSAKNDDWLESYQTERSMGVFMMRLTQTDDVLATIDDFRIDCLVKLTSQIEAYSTVTSPDGSLANALMARTNLNAILSQESLQASMHDVDCKLVGFDFIDYSQLFEDVIRPITMRSIGERELPKYNKLLSSVLSDTQSKNSKGLIIRNTVFKHFSEMLQIDSSLLDDDVPNVAMKLTQGYFAVKSAAVMLSLREKYQRLSIKRTLCVEELLKPVKLHRESIGLVGLAKSA